MEREKDRTNRRGPLIGLKVLDLADEKADFCSRLLADMGAEVIRVAPPGGRPFDGNTVYRSDGPCQGKYFSQIFRNINKNIFPQDLNLPDDRDILAPLIKKTDVIVESFTPGYLDDLGMGYHALSVENPGLIMASVTGFGQNGPLRDTPSCDLVAAGAGGQMFICGTPGSPPLRLFGEQSYFIASLFAAVGVLLALRSKRLYGHGRHIDISLQESVLATLDHVMPRFFNDGATARRQEGRHWNNLFEILPCKDGFLHLNPFLHWDSLVDWLDAEGMAEDLKGEAWRDETYRTDRMDHVVDVLKKWTRTHDVGDLFHTGQLMGFPWAPVQSPADIKVCPQLRDRRFLRYSKPAGEACCMPYPGMPYAFTPSFELPPRSAPLGVDDSSDHHRETPPLIKKASPDVGFKPSPDHRHSSILGGIRVLDFTRLLAGPYTTRILGDFGAQVIKVQSKKNATGVEDNREVYFSTWNRNKLGVSLDLNRPEARDLVLRLVEISDVVVENFSPRVMDNWGLDYASLRSKKSDIIMARMSAMGQTGPWRDYTAFAQTIQSLSGHTFLTAYKKDKPMGPGSSYADVVAGLYCALAVSTALDYRQTTGQGLMIDLSEYEAACTLLGPALVEAAAEDKNVLPIGNRSGSTPAAPHNCYPCLYEDQWCVIAVLNDSHWRMLCDVMGNPSWALDPKYSELRGRKAHERELDEHLAKWTAGYSATEIVDRLRRANVPAGIVATAGDLARDPHLMARGCFGEIAHPFLGGITTDRCPIRFMDDPPVSWQPSPLLGEHNAFVFKELLGLSDEKFNFYIKEGII